MNRQRAMGKESIPGSRMHRGGGGGRGAGSVERGWQVWELGGSPHGWGWGHREVAGQPQPGHHHIPSTLERLPHSLRGRICHHAAVFHTWTVWSPGSFWHLTYTQAPLSGQFGNLWECFWLQRQWPEMLHILQCSKQPKQWTILLSNTLLHSHVFEKPASCHLSPEPYSFSGINTKYLFFCILLMYAEFVRNVTTTQTK